MDVVTTLGAVSSALGVLKELKSIDAQFDQATLKLKIAELAEALSEAKLGLAEVSEQIRAKDAEIADLKKQVQYRAENLVTHKGLRYHAEDGQPKGLPYCSACEHKGLYMMLRQDRNKTGHPFVCPHCKADYGYAGIYQSGPAKSAEAAP